MAQQTHAPGRSPEPAAGPPPEPSAEPAIDEYAFLSDTHTGALLAPDGTVEWCCLPNFAAGSVFGRLLDRARGGAWHLTVPGAGLPHRRYVRDTLVLESSYRTGTATVTVYDFLALRTERGSGGDPIDPEHVLVRLVRVDGGPATIRTAVDARPDYGARHAQWWPAGDGGWRHGDPVMWLGGSHPLRPLNGFLAGEVELGDGDRYAMMLGYGDAPPRPVTVDAAEELLERSCRIWQEWSDRSDYDGVGRDQVRRSALLLRGLAFDESGGLLAALTTSLPEELGGERNWDYRFTWYRDAGLLLLAQFRLGHQEEGIRNLRFLLEVGAEQPQLPPPVVGIHGELRSAETTLDHLRGYAGSRPVRVGNDAFDQRQLDTYGHLLDAALAYQQLTGGLTDQQWQLLRAHVEQVCQRWRDPDHGIWEIRDEQRHYVNSKVMAWVALDRGIRLAKLRADDSAPLARWRHAAWSVRDQVLQHGFDRQAGSFVMAYGSAAVDASLLRIPLVGFLPGDDPRVVGTLDRVIRDLGVEGTPLLYRYDQSEVEDGLAGGEGAFLLSSFELVSALALAGRHEQAQQAYKWLCRQAGPLGLFSEQLAPDGTALGNYPQALSHLALIEAAMNLHDAGSTDALHRWAAARA